MPEDATIAAFLEKALAAGIPQDALVGLLTARGWREKEVYAALGEHYARQTGIEIPRRAGAGASAKDAFFYLLIFATLGTWTSELGALAFALIDRWFADPLVHNYLDAYSTDAVAWSLAAILVAFPLCMLISRAVAREAAADPDKLDSGVRKWLTYLALVVAACVFMGDLIAALAFFLHGEITSRFVAKAFVVLVLSGGVFYYYFGGLRKTDAVNPSRDRLMAWVSFAGVLLMLILGFSNLGLPSTLRDLRADNERLIDLLRLSTEIESYWKSHASQLPPNIDEFPAVNHLDPVTHARYEYLPSQGSMYRLCAVFARKSAPLPQNASNSAAFWAHPAGHACIQLDASQNGPSLPDAYGP